MADNLSYDFLSPGLALWCRWPHLSPKLSQILLTGLDQLKPAKFLPYGLLQHLRGGEAMLLDCRM